MGDLIPVLALLYIMLGFLYIFVFKNTKAEDVIIWPIALAILCVKRIIELLRWG